MQIRNNKEYEKRNIKENKTKKTSEIEGAIAMPLYYFA